MPQGQCVTQDISGEKLVFFGTLSACESKYYQREVKRLDARQVVSNVVSLAQIDLERLAVVCILNAFKLDNEVASGESIEGLGEWVRAGVVYHECRILQIYSQVRLLADIDRGKYGVKLTNVEC